MLSNSSSPRGNRSDSAKSLQKALTILECVSQFPNGASVKQISETLSMNKPIVSKTLGTFLEMGYVIQDPITLTYRLGTKLLYLSNKMTSSLDLYAIAKPTMQRLNQETGETINLALYNEQLHNLVYIHTIDGNHKLRLSNTIGTSPNLYSSAVGKSVLAYLPPEILQHILDVEPFCPRTKFSIHSKEELFANLEITRAQGFALSDEETIIGVRGIAAPIYKADKSILGSLAITGPKTRFPDSIVAQYGMLIREASREISSQLGYSKDK